MKEELLKILLKFQDKLLDLSKRNKMINSNFQSRSRTHFRIIEKIFMKKFKNYFIYGIFLSVLSISCSQKTVPASVPIPLERSPHKAFSCQKESQACWGFPACVRFCEELFFNKESRKKCLQWPMVLFEDFNNLLNIIRTQPFQEIDLKVLKCFMDLSEEDKTILFKRLNKDSAQEFLEEIAKTPELALILAKEDDKNFSIFRTLTKKVSSRIPTAIKGRGGSKNFLILLNENENRPAGVWLDDFISHFCRRDSSCDEPLDYYCKILDKTRSEPLKDFFENAYFKKEYKRNIESKSCGSQNCEYGNLIDFRSLCRSF